MPIITENTIYLSLSHSLYDTQLRQLQAQTVASSGLQVGQPADGPAQASTGTLMSAAIATLGAMDRAAQIAATALSATDGALATANNLLVRAREVAIQGGNGTLSAADQQTLAMQVQQYLQSMVAVANSQLSGNYLFSGYSQSAPPFSASGVYSGDGNTTQMEVAPGVQVATQWPGDSVFAPTGGQNIISVLSNLQAALSAHDGAAIAASLSAIDQAQNQISQARAQVGNSLTALQTANGERSRTSILLQQSRASTVEADPAAAFTNLVKTQQAYQAAVAQATQLLSGMSNGIAW